MGKRLPFVLFLFLIILFNLSLNSFCFSEQRSLMAEDGYISGKVIYVDFVASTVTIKFIQENGKSDEITFSVTQHTKINKGDLRLSLDNISQGDEVNVQYYDDPMSFTSLRAVQINLKPNN